MEKIVELPLSKPLTLVQANIEKRIQLISKTYAEATAQYEVSYCWNKKTSTLSIRSKNLGVKSKIKFSQSGIVGAIDVPFLLKPLFNLNRDKVIKKLKKEIHSFIKAI